LPDAFELSTAYTAAVPCTSRQPGLAARFGALLSGDDSRDLRAAGGFEFDDPG